MLPLLLLAASSSAAAAAAQVTHLATDSRHVAAAAGSWRVELGPVRKSAANPLLVECARETPAPPHAPPCQRPCCPR